VSWKPASSSTLCVSTPAIGVKDQLTSSVIGLTLVVAGDTFFLTLFAVIVFHQMFEGLALGTRIAALGNPCPTSAPAAGHGQGGAHNHAHGHEHYHDHADATPAATEPKGHPTGTDESSTHTAVSNSAEHPTGHVSMRKKLLLAAAFAIVTPLGMGIGIGVLHNFNGNDPATVIAIGTLDALSAGILVWVGVVEMWAHDWMLGGEMTRASPIRTAVGMTALVVGMALMSLLGKWA
jgi:zinc transporter 1/2/3